MHKAYDYIISKSKSMNKPFAEAFNSPVEKCVACGAPMVDYLKHGNKIEVENLYKKYPVLKKKINILYSPTLRSDGSDNVEEK